MKFFSVLAKHLTKVLAAMLLLSVALALGLAIKILNFSPKLPFRQEVLYLQPLGGERRPQKRAANPVAVVIDNNVDLVSQAGLNEAAIVYEALVEGGLTRFLAVYNYDDSIVKVGPVRSVRPYFLDWAAEYQAALLHVGGSPAALAAINQYSIIDLDEMGPAGVFFERGQVADWPHNVYTSSLLWQQVRELQGRRLDFKPWQYEETASQFCPPLEQAVAINYYQNYQVGWRYHCPSKKYLREDFAGPTDIGATNVIVQFVKSWLIDKERLGMQTVGAGKALFFKNGQVTPGRWEKANQAAKTLFYNEVGEPIKLSPGNTWIEVAPPLTKVTY